MKRYFDTIYASSLKEAEALANARIGENLSTLRRLRGETVNTVAKNSGISAASLRQYESGDTGITMPRAWALATYYQVPIEALVGDIKYVAPGDKGEDKPKRKERATA